MNDYQLYLLGSPRLEHGGQRIEINLKKALALLAYLGRTGQPQSRDLLATLLWPESDQSDGRASLRRTLYRLNRLADEEIISGTQELVEISPQVNLWIDVNAYEAAVLSCQLDQAGQIEEDDLPTLHEAAERYQDDFLTGFTLPDCPDFDEWQYFQREGLRQLQAQTVTALAGYYTERQAWTEAIRFARRRVALDALDEAGQRALVKLYAADGQPTAAIRQYEEFARLLDQELDVEPEPETIQLIEDVKSGRSILPAVESFTPPATQYVKTRDGVHIAYQVFGEGTVDLVAIWGFITHLEMLWENDEVRVFLQKLASFARIISLDRRGMGLSERIGYPPTPEHVAEDVLAIMDAIGSERAVIAGFSESGGVAATFAALHPERVQGIVLYGAMAKGVRAQDYPWVLTEEQYDAWLEMMVQKWGTAFNIEHFAPNHAQDTELKEWWQRYVRSASSPGTMRWVLEVMRDLDVRPILQDISIPTLVIHRTGDRAIRVGNGRYFAENLPNAQYVELEGNDHWWYFLEDQHQIVEPIEQFVNSLPSMSVEPFHMAAIVCVQTDNSQEEQLQDVVQHHQTHIVATDGMELFLQFSGPTPALRCAASLRSPNQKIGLHFGIVEASDGHIAGPAVQLARKLADAANDGEILTSLAVRGLTASSGFNFEEVDISEMSQLVDAWQVFRVR